MPPFWWCFAGTDDGTVYTVRDRDSYAIDAFAPDGTLLRTITRDYEPLYAPKGVRAREGMSNPP